MVEHAHTLWTPPAYQCVFVRAAHPGRNAASKHADPRSLGRFFVCSAVEDRFFPLSRCFLELMKSSLSGPTAGLTSRWD